MASVTRDLAIIGGGPAALTAALYAARAGLDAIVFERGTIGGTLAEISHIENFPGFVGAGPELAGAMRQQAEQAGARLAYGECTAVRKATEPAATPSDAQFVLTVDGEPQCVRAVLVATGSEPRPLNPTVQSAVTKPISYCALCDGALVRDQNVAVVGGANSALQEALYLAGLARSVTIISHSAIKADTALQERVASVPNITIKAETEPTAALLNEFDRIFVYIGKHPATAFLEPLAAEADSELLDQQGYVRTVAGGTYATSITGLFVAGDVRSGALRQVVTAAADGAAAAVEINNYLRDHLSSVN